MGRLMWPGSLWCHLRYGVTAAMLSWPLVLGAEYGWFWFPGGWSRELMPALCVAAFAAYGVFRALGPDRADLEASAGSLRQMWPALTPIAVAVARAAPMALLSRSFVDTYSNDYERTTGAGYIAVPWVLASVFALGATWWFRTVRRLAQQDIDDEAASEAAAAQRAASALPSPGEVWFAVPPLRGGTAADMKERPCVVLDAPVGAGVRCVSCTSQEVTASKRGYPRLDTTAWSTEKDETFVRVDMVDVVPLATFRKRVAVLDRSTFASIYSAAAQRRGPGR